MTYALPPNPAFPDDGEVLLDVGYEALMSAAAALLQRRVFCAPQFVDRPDGMLAPLEAVANILHLAAGLAHMGEEPHQIDLAPFFENVTRLIILYWPNSETAEIELGSARRPPQALRQALAYILSKRGIVESAASVANNSGTGLRTLENLFCRWLGVGVARYAKILRIKFLRELQENTKSDLASLAEVYRFSNVSRLRHEILNLDLNTTAALLPQNFYQELLDGMAGQDLVVGSLAQAACVKGNYNA
ncbi:MAG: hypothetical protein QE484_15910 [Rhizobium sp.]|nr:hypothetical protein [Rhizobium sp.]